MFISRPIRIIRFHHHPSTRKYTRHLHASNRSHFIDRRYTVHSQVKSQHVGHSASWAGRSASLWREEGGATRWFSGKGNSPLWKCPNIWTGERMGFIRGLSWATAFTAPCVHTTFLRIPWWMWRGECDWIFRWLASLSLSRSSLLPKSFLRTSVCVLYAYGWFEWS